MKRDELTAHKADVTIPVYGTIADADVYLKEKVDSILAKKDKKIEELKAALERDFVAKKSAEKVLRDLLDCGLIKEWFYNGTFHAVLKADDPHLEIAELKQKLDKAIAERDGNQVCIDALNEKLGAVNEFIKASKELLKESQKMHQRCADNASKQIRRLKRALYKACANWAKCEERISNMDAYDASEYLPSAENKFRKKAKRWSEMKSKCLKKVEEYKR